MAKEKKQNPREHAGELVKNLQNLHNTEYKIVFNLHENTFFQKMVNKEVLEKGVRVKPEDYFKALVFLSYFCGTLENDYTVCDNLVRISKVLREEEKTKGEDKGTSYLNLEAIVLGSAMATKERLLKTKQTSYTSKEKKEIQKRYKTETPVSITRQLDPYYEAIGEMVCSLVDENLKPYLGELSRRTDIEVLVFANAILPLLNKAESKQVYDYLQKKDYFSASMNAFDSLLRKAPKYFHTKFKSAVEEPNKNDS